jgi:signal transduction histidine kinase
MAIVNDILDFSKIEAGLSKPLQAPELQAALEHAVQY